MSYEVGVPQVRTFDFFRCLLIGPPKHGKTTMAATMSKFYKDEVPAGEQVVLDDMFHLDFDDNAQDGLRERGITIPRFQDANDDPILPMLDGKGLLTACDDIPKQLKEIATEKRKQYGHFTIIVDTVSTYNGMLDSYLTEKTNDSRDKYGIVFNKNKRLFNNLKVLPCDIIFVCHLKELVTMDKEGDAKLQKTQKVSGMPGRFDVKADIIGKAKNFYVNNTSMTLPLVAEAKTGMPGKGITYDRAVYPYGHKALGIEGGTRFQANLNEKEPADFRVILKKLGKERA